MSWKKIKMKNPTQDNQIGKNKLTEILSARWWRSETEPSLSPELQRESAPELAPFSRKSVTIRAKSCSLSWLNPPPIYLPRPHHSPVAVAAHINRTPFQFFQIEPNRTVRFSLVFDRLIESGKFRIGEGEVGEVLVLFCFCEEKEVMGKI